MDRAARIRRRRHLAGQRRPDRLGRTAVPRMDPAPQRRYPADRIEAVSRGCRDGHRRKGMTEPAAGSRPRGSDTALRPLAWVRRQFPRQMAGGRRRLAPRTPRGFWLTFTASVGALAALAFGAVTQDMAGHDGMAVHDPRVTAWMVAHRAEWLTSVLRVITWLGSTAVIIPLGGDRRGLLRPAATQVAAAGTAGRRRGRPGWPVQHRQALDRPAAAAAGDMDRVFLGCSVPVRARGSVGCLLRDARHRPGRGEIALGEDCAVERGRARRAGRGRLTYLPGSPLADRRPGRLCARCLLGCHCRYRHACHLVTTNRRSGTGRARERVTTASGPDADR